MLLFDSGFAMAAAIQQAAKKLITVDIVSDTI
jgi:hypothetical protein